MPNTKDETMRVWVGCLGCYNAGHLLGEWFDAIDAPTDMAEFNGPNYPGQLAVRGAHTSDDTECPHEELWVFDHENFGGLLTGECSPMEAKRIAEAVADVSDLGAFKAYVGYVGYNEADSIADFEDAFCGEYESGEDYAQELAEELGLVDDSAKWPAYCIDWERAWRELSMDGYFEVDSPRGVYIFRSV